MEALPQNTNRLYFICCIGRTGSNHLCQMLRSTGVMGYPSEYYNRAGSYDNFRKEWGGVPPANFFAQLCKRTRTANGVVGVKVAMDAMKLCLSTRPWWFDYLDIRYVHLQRRDTLRQAISLYRAYHSGIWSGANDHSKDPPYDAAAIFRTQVRIHSLTDKWKKWFSKSGIEPLPLWYEYLGVDSAVAVGDHLGVTIDPATVKSSAKVMRDDKTEEWVRRLEGG